jgi:hypothetical protein
VQPVMTARVLVGDLDAAAVENHEQRGGFPCVEIPAGEVALIWVSRGGHDVLQAFAGRRRQAASAGLSRNISMSVSCSWLGMAPETIEVAHVPPMY